MGSVGASTQHSLAENSQVAPADTKHPAVKTSKIEEEDAPLRTVEDLMVARARANPDRIILSYPSQGIEYVDYTMQQLDVFAYRAAVRYRDQLGDMERHSSAEKPRVVAMLGASNLEYLITMLAMIKLGHTILFLSTRISPEAVESLMATTGAQALLYDTRYTEAAAYVKDKMSQTQLVQMVTRPVFEFPIAAVGDTRLDAALDRDIETNNTVYIIHSSGTTGFPKPIYQAQKAALANYATSMEMKAFITLPLYHNHGICNFFRAIYCGKPIHMYNADLPLTSDLLTKTFQQHQFEIFYGVPYALKLLAESEGGIALLRDLKVVMFGGSACPDELGDLLVDNGVNLISHYGATEVGQLMTSFRPAGDKAWNYVREHAALEPYLRWIPRGPNLFECSVLDGWKALTTSNQPDKSYTTKDLFEPHPTMPKAWKYIARLDDTLVLVNGEKFNPVQMEGRIRSEPSVAEAVIFGAGRPYLGLLVVPSEMTAGKSREEILEIIWPTVEASNQTAEAYAHISRNMIALLPGDTAYPRTDKGSIIRQAFYRNFAKEIEETYDAAETSSGNLQALNLGDLKIFLAEAIKKAISKKNVAVEDDTDLFALGLDSLNAIQLRSEILRNIDVGGKPVGQNVVFDYPSVERLAAHLVSLRTGEVVGSQFSIEEEMETMIRKHTEMFSKQQQPKSSIVVTGSTGSLGAHIAARLTKDPSVQHIYCFVRAGTEQQATERLEQSLIQRNIFDDIPSELRTKLHAIPFDLSDPHLGLSDDTYATIGHDLRSVIHCAWSVNFTLHLSSFERDCITGVQHLMKLCLATGSTPATFNFCSSVSAVSMAPNDKPVPEELAALGWAQGMGYAQSKSVAEHMCVKVAEKTGLKARVLRVGQIIGDTKHGIWNASEAIPMQLQSAITIGALPTLTETPSWLPVDTVAQAFIDISLSDAGTIVTNVVNKETFRWTEDLLPALRTAGLPFEQVSPKEWVKRLRESNPDPVENPPIKLVDFFASKYDRAMEDLAPSKIYATAKACSLSAALASAPVLDQDTVNKFTSYFVNNAWKKSEAKVMTGGKQ